MICAPREHRWVNKFDGPRAFPCNTFRLRHLASCSGFADFIGPCFRLLETLAEVILCGSSTLRNSYLNSLRLSRLSASLPVRIVTHTLTRSAHNHTPLRKTLWDIVYFRDTTLAAYRSCGADADQQRLRAVVSFVRSATQLLRISLRSLRPFWHQAFCSKYGLAKSFNLSGCCHSSAVFVYAGVVKCCYAC